MSTNIKVNSLGTEVIRFNFDEELLKQTNGILSRHIRGEYI